MDVIKKIGKTDASTVYHVVLDGCDYAMKKIKHDTHGVSIEALREIHCLTTLVSPHVVTLYHVEFDSKNTILLLELASTDLRHYIDHYDYDCDEVLKQIILSVSVCHQHNIMHRDIKPQNFLVYIYPNETVLKIADFGLAAEDVVGYHSDNVVSMWYRAPEVLANERYHKTIDIWSVGCVFYELITKNVLYKGRSEQHQLLLIRHTVIDGIADSDKTILLNMLNKRLMF